jgi:hypothetical protein
MSSHISDDLPRLLTGDATRDEVLGAAEHLRGCPDCQQELVSAVVAHASLTSAQRFAPEILARALPAAGRPGEPGAPLPDMSAVFAKVRDEASAAGKPKHRRRLLAAAAAAVVLAGAGVTIAETVGSDSSHVQSHTVALAAYGSGTHPAKATLVGDGSMRVDATALPRLDARHFYEVWLTDAGRQHLQAVGSIGNDNRAQLTISSKVMSQYTAIEVSVQRVNQTTYSGTSVLRGTYG